jgi:hypothetical protein
VTMMNPDTSATFCCGKVVYWKKLVGWNVTRSSAGLTVAGIGSSPGSAAQRKSAIPAATTVQQPVPAEFPGNCCTRRTPGSGYRVEAVTGLRRRLPPSLSSRRTAEALAGGWSAWRAVYVVSATRRLNGRAW